MRYNVIYNFKYISPFLITVPILGLAVTLLSELTFDWNDNSRNDTYSYVSYEKKIKFEIKPFLIIT